LPGIISRETAQEYSPGRKNIAQGASPGFRFGFLIPEEEKKQITPDSFGYQKRPANLLVITRQKQKMQA
jgi:hypothetical protein